MNETIKLPYSYTSDTLWAVAAIIDRHAGDDYSGTPQEIDYSDLKRLREFRNTILDTLSKEDKK